MCKIFSHLSKYAGNCVCFELYLDKNVLLCENDFMAAKSDNKDNNSQDEFREQVRKCIEAYKELLNTGMALDYCRVQGKQRTFILRDPEFIRETKAIRAEKYRNELEEVQQIYDAASKLGESSDDGDDGRTPVDRRRKKSKVGSDKDALGMQLKAASMRRELMSLTAEDNSDNEESTLNFFFTALTREEMEALKEVELNRGTGDDSALMAMGSEDSEEDVAAQAKKRNEKNKELNKGNITDNLKDMSPEQREELLMALVSLEGK